jgi:signal transduction histidine kinase
VDLMAERARAITAESLTERLPVGNPEDELGRLATVFNETLTRLEASFDQMKRFTSHASHELRTPLTAIRSVGEVGLRQRRDESGYRDVIGSMLEEADRLAQLVDRLLILSRIEFGPRDLSSDIVDLSALAEEAAGHLGVLAEEKQQTIEVHASRRPLWSGDRTLLRQALLNLVDNAIKYTPERGRITVRVESGGNRSMIEVADTGPGIPRNLQTRVFDRFYRVDESRAQGGGGAGLGLSIARWAVEACGGRLTLERAGSGGSTFRITLPSNVTDHQPANLSAVISDQSSVPTPSD